MLVVAVHGFFTCENGDQLCREVIRLRPSAAIIHVTTATANRDFDLVKQLIAKSPNTAIITASHETLPALILGSMRAGAREFLPLPIVADEFRSVMDRIVEFSESLEGSTAKKAHIIATFSGKVALV